MKTSWTVGDVRIDLFAEDEGPFNSIDDALPDLSEQDLENERDWFDGHGYEPDSRRLVLSFHGYLVQTPSLRILVDTCVGNHKSLDFRQAWNQKSDTRWMTALAEVGLTTSDIDLVINTHLHLDHVGWNTTWIGDRWIPTFQNARYVISSDEYRGVRRRSQVGQPNAALHRVSLAESIAPLEEYGVLELVASDAEVATGVRLLPTPGHTNGHVAVLIEDGAAVFTGDLMHSPIQAARPELSWSGDEDPILAAQTRRAFCERFADTETLVCTMHFPEPAAGYLRTRGGGFSLEAAPTP